MKAFHLLFAVVFLSLLPPIVQAHGDVHVLIDLVSKEIEKTPNNPDLFLKRGQLYTEDRDFKNARKDYLHARNLQPDLYLSDLLLAELYAEHQKADSALIWVNLFLKKHPNDGNALITRAGIYTLLSSPTLAQQDIEQAFQKLKNPSTKHYTFIAKTIIKADSTQIDEALKWLHLGQQRIGFDIVLLETEIKLATKAGRYQHAIGVTNDVMQRFPRKEKWLYQKGQILEKACQNKAALKEYEATLSAINQLPLRFRKTSKMIELEALALEGIHRLKLSH